MSKPTVSAAGGATPAECRQHMKAVVAALDPNLRASTRRTLKQMARLIAVDAPEGIAGREPLLDVADMLEKIHALIDAKHYADAEAKLAEAKAMLAAVKIEGGAQ
jgi:hypothetical protein